MKSQRIKDIYFALIKPLSMLNYYRHNFINSDMSGTKYKKPLFLNIGSGASYMDGFVNIEGNIFNRKDMWLDIRNGLPFPDNSVDVIYACHILEHFYMSELLFVLKEFKRVTKPYGAVRILVPSLEMAVNAYTKGEDDWFDEFPVSYKSLGGRLYNFLLCDGQHQLFFDYAFMEEILQETGFSHISNMNSGGSDIFKTDELQKMEDNNDHHIKTSLIIEAR